MSERADTKRQRTAFGEDDTDENLRGSIIKGKQALAAKETDFKWENPSLSLISSALRILIDQNKIVMKQNELILRELETRVQSVKSK
jgi:5-methylcytosine-specific restriction endonuclease McrBC regulatory subunit McrC